VYHPDNLTTFGRQTPQAHEPVLPLRHFIVAGVSAKSALLAYEQGGSDYISGGCGKPAIAASSPIEAKSLLALCGCVGSASV
jgi:hypothetical protein